MWRQYPFLGNGDSDQSISDEEDFKVDSQDNCVSLGGHFEKEEGLQLQSRLDILKRTNELDSGEKFSNLSPSKQTSDSLEDEVEMPHFLGEDGSICFQSKVLRCNLDEEVISDDEVNVIRSEEQSKTEDKWSAASKEAEALMHLNENAFCAYARASSSCKGMKSKSKPKFSFHFQSHKEGASWPAISKNGNIEFSNVHEVAEQSGTIDHGEHSITELLEDYKARKPKQSEAVPSEVLDVHRFREHSVAENLDGIWDTSMRKNSKMYSRTRGKKPEVVVSRIIPPLGDRTADCEDLAEPICSISSSDDEGQRNNQTLTLAVPEMKRQTLADRFEALGGTLNDERALAAVSRPSGVGLFGKLQQVMQSEKFTDTVFWKLQNGASPDAGEPDCINVKILSRYLDAKLIVCHAFSFKHNEGPDTPKTTVDGGRVRTIIFNPRVCCDVDLEVGRVIRVHPPWKEVQVKGYNESIILSTYFSQIPA